MSAQWSHGLCGCFGDLTTCLITWFVPCYTEGKNAESVGEDCLKHAIFYALPFVGWYCGAVIRGKVRDKKGIEGSFINDLLCHMFCALCALVQESQELGPEGQSMARE